MNESFGVIDVKPRGMDDPDYARIFTQARIIAWQFGFALIHHGTCTRDLDLLLVPWEERATEKMAFRLINQIAIHSNLTLKSDEPKQMPHALWGWLHFAKAIEAQVKARNAHLWPPEKPHKPRRVKVVSKAAGGHARAAALSPERRREIALKANAARWSTPQPE